MARALVLGLMGATAALVACGTAVDNSWSGDEVFTNANASWLDYPESDASLVASEIDAAADGFAMGDDRATVSMHEMTCGVHIDTGTVFFDLDLRPGEIQDGLDSSSGEGGSRVEITSLLVAPPLVSLVPVDRPFQDAQYLVRGVREARLLDADSFVALRATEDDSCELRWYEDGRLASMQPLTHAACVGDLGFAVDRISGDAWIATPDGVFSVTHEGARVLPVEGDLLAWDAAEGQLYVATRGSDTVSALVDGEVVWTLTLPGAITDLDDGGQRGGLVVSHEEGLGYSVDRFDGQGVELDHLAFDQPVLDVAISDGGDLMGVARVDDHAYYRLR